MREGASRGSLPHLQAKVTRRRWWITIGVGVVIAAAAVGLSLALAGGGSKGPAASPPGLSELYKQTHVGEREDAVLARWPKNPYQHYTDNVKEDCYEWQGDDLYNLCFKNGVLRLKTVF
jgi:hypothetical protein